MLFTSLSIGCGFIAALPGPADPNAFLFPRHAEGRGSRMLTNCWRTVCAGAKLGSLRLHDLRHRAVSQAVMAGENQPTDFQFRLVKSYPFTLQGREPVNRSV